MNIFKTILSHLKQWFSSPQTLDNEIKAAQVAVRIAGPGLVLLIQEAGSTSPEFANVDTELQADLTKLDTVLTSIQEGTGGAVEVESVLESVKTNLGPLLDAAHIKDATLRTRITDGYNAFVAEVEAIISELPPAPPAPKA